MKPLYKQAALCVSGDGDKPQGMQMLRASFRWLACSTCCRRSHSTLWGCACLGRQPQEGGMFCGWWQLRETKKFDGVFFKKRHRVREGPRRAHLNMFQRVRQGGPNGREPTNWLHSILPPDPTATGTTPFQFLPIRSIQLFSCVQMDKTD